MEIIKNIAKKPEGAFWLFIISTIFLAALLADFIIPYDISARDVVNLEQAPSASHFFGTDKLGRDILSRTIVGIRISLFIGFFARIIALIIGVTLGVIAAYYGGIIDNIISRLIDSTLAFPSLLLAIAISISIGQGYATLIISLSLVAWAPIARLLRSSASQIVNMPYIEAVRSFGASDFRILFYHILPNCSSTIIVSFTSGLATTIMSESSLNFLGLGPDASVPTIGQMIYAGVRDIQHPWVAIFPAIFLSLIILSFNILGDMLRDALDPREN
ncbi:MAG: ABC transporter permease [Candidatus Wallbacteria bacterium]